MRNIFIGFVFIFLDFSLNLGNSKIGFIPDFIGYLIMISGLVEMSEKSMFFMKVKPYASGMAIYTGILYFLDLMGVSVSLGLFTYILALTSTAISLYISYNIVMGIIDMEERNSLILNGNSLKSIWTLLAVFNILSYLMMVIPLLGIMSVVVSFIVAICFLVSFNNTKNRYYSTVG